MTPFNCGASTRPAKSAAIAIGPDNQIVVADTANRRVQVLRYVGEP